MLLGKNPPKQSKPTTAAAYTFMIKCVSLGSLAFRTLLIGVLKRGPTATGPRGTLFQDPANLNDGGKAEEMWSGVCNWGITGKLVEECRVELD